MNKISTILIGLSLVVIFSGCAPKTFEPVPPLDENLSPDHLAAYRNTPVFDSGEIDRYKKDAATMLDSALEQVEHVDSLAGAGNGKPEDRFATIVADYQRERRAGR